MGESTKKCIKKSQAHENQFSKHMATATQLVVVVDFEVSEGTTPEAVLLSWLAYDTVSHLVRFIRRTHLLGKYFDLCIWEKSKKKKLLVLYESQFLLSSLFKKISTKDSMK